MAEDREGHDAWSEETPVLVYRLMQHTMMDILHEGLGNKRVDPILRASGSLAGNKFAHNSLDLKADFQTFIASLKKALADLKINLLRIESFNPDTGNLAITMRENPDNSALETTRENVHIYEVSFITGILEAYTGKRYSAWEG